MGKASASRTQAQPSCLLRSTLCRCCRGAPCTASNTSETYLKVGAMDTAMSGASGGDCAVRKFRMLVCRRGPQIPNGVRRHTCRRCPARRPGWRKPPGVRASSCRPRCRPATGNSSSRAIWWSTSPRALGSPRRPCQGCRAALQRTGGWEGCDAWDSVSASVNQCERSTRVSQRLRSIVRKRVRKRVRGSTDLQHGTSSSSPPRCPTSAG